MLTYPYTVKNPVTSTFSLAKLSPNRPYLLWWYAALVKGSESGQNNLQVLFREILDRTDTGLELGKIVKEILPLPLLGQYLIGSIWINGKSVKEVHYPVVEFKVSFTEGCWRYKTFNAQSKLGKQNDPFPLDLYPLLYGANDFSRLIEFDLDNGGKLVLNGMDFFRAAYGHSPELKRILTSYPYQIKPPSQGDSILSLLLPPFPSHLKPSGNLDVLQPSHKFVKQDAVFLAHLKRDAHTKQVVHEFANNCFKSFFNQSKKGSIPFVFLAPEPWHTHPDVTIRVRGIPFDNQKSFLGLNILGISDPPGPDIMWWKKSMASGSGSGGEPVIIRRTVKLSEVPVSATFAASWDAANLALPLHNQLIGDKRNIVTAKDQDVGVGGGKVVPIDNTPGSGSILPAKGTGTSVGGIVGQLMETKPLRYEQMWLEAQELKRQGLITEVEWLNGKVFETKPDIGIIKIAGNTGTTPPVVGAFVMRLTLSGGKQLVCIELIGRNGKEDFTGLMVEVNEMVSTLPRWVNWVLREVVKHAGVFNKFIKKSLYTHYKVYKHGEEGRNTVERVMRALFS